MAVLLYYQLHERRFANTHRRWALLYGGCCAHMAGTALILIAVAKQQQQMNRFTCCMTIIRPYQALWWAQVGYIHARSSPVLSLRVSVQVRHQDIYTAVSRATTHKPHAYRCPWSSQPGQTNPAPRATMPRLSNSLQAKKDTRLQGEQPDQAIWSDWRTT